MIVAGRTSRPDSNQKFYWSASMITPAPSRSSVFIITFALAAIFALSTVASGQGRGNGNGAGPNLDKKCAKFVNCHDARDGRWDGRGPAMNPVFNPQVIPVQPQPNVNIGRTRNRDRDRDNQVWYPRSRNRRVSSNSD